MRIWGRLILCSLLQLWRDQTNSATTYLGPARLGESYQQGQFAAKSLDEGSIISQGILPQFGFSRNPHEASYGKMTGIYGMDVSMGGRVGLSQTLGPARCFNVSAVSTPIFC